MVFFYLVIFLWFLMGTTLIMQLKEAIAQLSIIDQVIVFVLLYGGAPVLILSGVIETLLEIIMPGEDFDDN